MSPRAPRNLLRRVLPLLVGPDAAPALEGKPGILLGAQRAPWIDALAFAPRPGASWRQLVELRFADYPPWDVIGLSLGRPLVAPLEAALLRALVPGDALTSENGVFVHAGDAWRPSRVIRS